jgi:hypothetical protein
LPGAADPMTKFQNLGLAIVASAMLIPAAAARGP